jgi:hypothetical protein
MPKLNDAQKRAGTKPATQSTDPNCGNLDRERVLESCMEALLFGEFTAPTPIEEMAKLCPAVWVRAVRVFGGDDAAARDWMDSPSPLLAEELPLLVALRVGGTRKVLRAFQEMARQARKERAGLIKRNNNPVKVDARSDRGDKLRTKRQYEMALARIDTLLDAKAGTTEGDELDRLTRLVQDYEKRTFGP